MRAKHFITLDTETTGLPPHNFVFDIGYTISTRKAVKLERSFLVREILTEPRYMLAAINNKDWRTSFGGKIFSHYMPELDQQLSRLTNWREIVNVLRDDMATYDVDVFGAYNLNFDMRAIAKTQATIIEGGKVLAYKPDLLDLWLFACQTAFNSQLYHDFADRYGFRSPAGNVRTTAEKAYAFLMGDPSFVEAHTALDDARIETQILHRLLARKKTIPYNDVQHMPWKIAQKIA